MSTAEKTHDLVSVYEDIRSEQAVIGSCIYDRDAMPVALRILQPDDFYRVWHQFVFRVMTDLWNRREPCDIVTICSEIQRRSAESRKHSEPDAWESYLVECVGSIPHGLHVEWYAQRVQDMASRRRVERELMELATTAAQLDDSVDSAIDEATKRLREARGATIESSRLKYIGDIPDDALRGALPNVKVGGVFEWMDKLTGGFEPGQLIIVAARPSVGKSAIVVQWLLQVAQDGKPTAMLSLEMPDRDVRNRSMAMLSNVNMHTFRSGGTLSIDEHARVNATRERLSTVPFAVDDDPDTSLRGVLARARHAIETQRVALIGIDYLTMIQDQRKNENRNAEVGRIVSSFKQLAREYQLPVIVLAQLNRGVELRPNAEPQLSDLRDSGEIEQHADIVVMLHKTDEFGAVKLLVRKNRNGPTGYLPLRFRKDTATFVGEDER